MQFQVPQFIETEDKMFGGILTLRQFIYIAAGGGIAILLFFTVQTTVAVIFGLIAIGAAAAFAFIKIEGRSLSVVVMAAVGFYWKPQTYIWQPEYEAVEIKAQNTRRKTQEVEPTGGFSLEKMLADMALKKQWKNEAEPEKPVITREAASAGMALHKKWQTMQTGEKTKPEKIIERNMDNRYLIFERKTGERQAARRVDYR
ncbi:MAG: PrgI family protein [Patescibacteria group bacterium]|nr:PrgI family protein [Patescibacteria group bacterium]